MSQNEDIYLEVQPISCRAASEEDREHEDSSPESEKEREEEGDVPSQNAMDEEDAAAALAKEIRYRGEWMLFNNVTMRKPLSMRTLKNSLLARETFMRMREPPPLQTSLHAASSRSSTPEAKRRRGHVGGDTEERTTKRTKSCHVHD